MTTARAYQKYIWASPKKLRRFSSPLKGKRVPEVEAILKYAPSHSSIYLLRAVHSAAANLRNKMGMDAPEFENIIVNNIQINQGPTYKRLNRRARGSADIYRSKSSHITVEVKI